MIPIQRMGHATIETQDIDRALEYYEQVTGLVIAARDSNAVHLASKIGQLAITLVKSDRADCTKLSFEVSPDSDFSGFAKRLASEGIRSELRSDPFPGASKALSFADPKGTTIELFSEWGPVAARQDVAGIGPLKVGHVAFFVPDLKKIVDFYQRILGFRVSDWIGDFFVFMRCNSDHHSVNFFRGDKAQIHHMAFELKDFAHIQQGCESLAARRIPLTWGPMRHGPGHNIAIYHRNADDHVIEHYCELDQMKSEQLGYFDPRPWHADLPQRPKVWQPGTWISGWGLPPTANHTRAQNQTGEVSQRARIAGTRG